MSLGVARLLHSMEVRCAVIALAEPPGPGDQVKTDRWDGRRLARLPAAAGWWRSASPARPRRRCASCAAAAPTWSKTAPGAQPAGEVLAGPRAPVAGRVDPDPRLPAGGCAPSDRQRPPMGPAGRVGLIRASIGRWLVGRSPARPRPGRHRPSVGGPAAPVGPGWHPGRPPAHQQHRRAAIAGSSAGSCGPR